jgi:hypothetical protein
LIALSAMLAEDENAKARGSEAFAEKPPVRPKTGQPVEHELQPDAAAETPA